VDLFCAFLDGGYTPEELLFFLYCRQVLMEEVSRSVPASQPNVPGMRHRSEANLGVHPTHIKLQHKQALSITRVVFGRDTGVLFQAICHLVDDFFGEVLGDPEASTKAAASREGMDAYAYLRLLLSAYHDTMAAAEQHMDSAVPQDKGLPLPAQPPPSPPRPTPSSMASTAILEEPVEHVGATEESGPPPEGERGSQSGGRPHLAKPQPSPSEMKTPSVSEVDTPTSCATGTTTAADVSPKSAHSLGSTLHGGSEICSPQTPAAPPPTPQDLSQEMGRHQHSAAPCESAVAQEEARETPSAPESPVQEQDTPAPTLPATPAAASGPVETVVPADLQMDGVPPPPSARPAQPASPTLPSSGKAGNPMVTSWPELGELLEVSIATNCTEFCDVMLAVARDLPATILHNIREEALEQLEQRADVLFQDAIALAVSRVKGQAPGLNANGEEVGEVARGEEKLVERLTQLLEKASLTGGGVTHGKVEGTVRLLLGTAWMRHEIEPLFAFLLAFARHEVASGGDGSGVGELAGALRAGGGWDTAEGAFLAAAAAANKAGSPPTAGLSDSVLEPRLSSRSPPTNAPGRQHGFSGALAADESRLSPRDPTMDSVDEGGPASQLPDGRRDGIYAGEAAQHATSHAIGQPAGGGRRISSTGVIHHQVGNGHNLYINNTYVDQEIPHK
ncbi:hypothetical protein CYMTET_28740, partial [Cymbomonas tetramitiformis]